MAKNMIYKLGQRSIPVPSGASLDIQNNILETDIPDVKDWQKTIPANNDEWLTTIDQMDAAELAFIDDNCLKENISVVHDKINGIAVYHVSPDEIDPLLEDSLFVHVHGGGYVFGGGEACLTEALLIAKKTKIKVLSIDYRMPPSHPFPAGLDDVVEVYRHLLKERSASSIALGGSSAGGGLALASIMQFQQHGLELPKAVFAGTPWTDLSKNGDSYFINEGLDRSLVSYEGILAEMAKLYAGENDLKHPLISPIYGDFEGFPPVFLISGSRDLFLSCTIRAHCKLRSAGSIADLIVLEGLSHGDYVLLVDSPESALFHTELNAFLAKHLQ